MNHTLHNLKKLYFIHKLVKNKMCLFVRTYCRYRNRIIMTWSFLKHDGTFSIGQVKKYKQLKNFFSKDLLLK